MNQPVDSDHITAGCGKSDRTSIPPGITPDRMSFGSP